MHGATYDEATKQRENEDMQKWFKISPIPGDSNSSNYSFEVLSETSAYDPFLINYA